MAHLQWDGMERVATIAQLTGVDALGLISTILQAAQAVRRNKETCQELVQEVQLIRDLLRMLQDPEMMRREEIVNALNGLETLKEAYALVASCRDCSAMYRFFMGWKQADQFRRVKKKIGKHLRFYPMISHADLTCRLEKIANSAALSTCSSQDAQEVLASSSTNHPEPELRAEEVSSEFEKPPMLTQSINDEERHRAAHQDAMQTSSRKSRSWWHDVVSSKKAKGAATSHKLPRAIELFTFAELATATMNFALERKIRDDGFSRVYKGVLPDGREVAIKRQMASSSYDRWVEEFRAEVTIHSLLHHKHIVRLIGCCVVEERRLSFGKKNEEELLVFEHMKNGSLFDHLHGPSPSSFSSPVTASWKTRIQILLGLSRAIDYLHSYAVPAVIHRDIKSSNVLLNSGWSPRLSGFGLAGSSDEAEFGHISVCGTMGYIDPEFVCTGTLKPTSDIYNFGVVMLEVLTGRKPFSHWEEEDNEDCDSTIFLTSALRLIEAGELRKVLDKRPAAKPTPRQLEAAELVARTVARCLQREGKDRPAMSDVMADLQGALELVCCDELEHVRADDMESVPPDDHDVNEDEPVPVEELLR
uniref:Protein kinase domain-containing protein n=1 Tax=Oryza brachyantha TaxID=4533 RepID=J3NA25_ORYBR